LLNSVKHFTNLFIYNSAFEMLKHALKELREGSAVTFVVGACYACGVIEMKYNKIVLLTSCRTHEKSSGRNLGSVFVNPFFELIEESFLLVNNSYPPITTCQLIRSIRLGFLGRGCLQTPDIFSTQAKTDSQIFQCLR